MNSMPLLAFLSMDNLDGFVSDDELAIKPLQKYGWTVKTVSWRQPCDWGLFDMVIIRTTWDYQNRTGEFLEVLEKIDASGTLLQNDLDLVKWNIRKTYLRELEAKGAFILSSLNQTPLYARVDFVRDRDNQFAVMEVELIEPALYFRMDHPHAAERFAHTVNNWVGRKIR